MCLLGGTVARPRRRLYQLGGNAVTQGASRLPELDYEPLLETAVSHRAVTAGLDPYELVLNLMLQNDGHELLMFTHEK